MRVHWRRREKERRLWDKVNLSYSLSYDAPVWLSAMLYHSLVLFLYFIMPKISNIGIRSPRWRTDGFSRNRGKSVQVRCKCHDPVEPDVDIFARYLFPHCLWWKPANVNILMTSRCRAAVDHRPSQLIRRHFVINIDQYDASLAPEARRRLIAAMFSPHLLPAGYASSQNMFAVSSDYWLISGLSQ